MKHKEFFEAIVGVERVVAGLRLRPLSIWHWLWLEALENPVLRPGASLNAAQLIQAAQVCASDFEDLPKAVCRKGWWRRAVTVVRTWRMWLVRGGLEAEVEAFARYIDDWFVQPEVWNTEGDEGDDKKDPPLPHYWFTLAKLVKSGVSRRDAWMMPLGEALFLSTTWAVMESGSLEFISEWDREMMAALEARKRAKEEAEGVAKAEGEG